MSKQPTRQQIIDVLRQCRQELKNKPPLKEGEFRGNPEKSREAALHNIQWLLERLDLREAVNAESETKYPWGKT